MKIRMDYVTNSSSSSFILARNEHLNEKQKDKIIEYVEKTFLGENDDGDFEEIDGDLSY